MSNRSRICWDSVPLKLAIKFIAVFQLVLGTVILVFLGGGTVSYILVRNGSQGRSDNLPATRYSPITTTSKPLKRTRMLDEDYRVDVDRRSTDSHATTNTPTSIHTPPPTPGDIEEGEGDGIDNWPSWAKVILAVGVVGCMLTLILASANLFRGARDKTKPKCRFWMVVNILLFFLVGVIGGFLCFQGISPIILGLMMFCEVVHGYFIFLVHAFIQQQQQDI